MVLDIKEFLNDNDKSGFHSEENVITVGLDNFNDPNKKITSNNKKTFLLCSSPQILLMKKMMHILK